MIGGGHGLKGQTGDDDDDEDLEERVGDNRGKQLQFAVAKETGAVAKKIRRVLAMEKPSSKAELVLLDLADNGSYYVHEGKVDEAVIQRTIRSFRDGTLKKTFLKGVAF
mmetsp:Transcript_41107/g.49862  ORF Transcript_41107/g.49862 Transcript_41107/m.49862 type:complete len:109 (+) Transcript_41107:246-572(+)